MILNKYSSDRNEKSFHRHTIPSVTLSGSPVTLRLGSRETVFIPHMSTEDQNCPRCNQRRAALSVWDRCESSSLRCSPKTGGVPCSGRICAQLFFSIPLPRRKQSSMFARSTLKVKPASDS